MLTVISNMEIERERDGGESVGPASSAPNPEVTEGTERTERGAGRGGARIVTSETRERLF